VDICEAIKRARMEKGMSQKDLAQAIGVAQTNVSQWERGGTRPKARNLKRLSEVLEQSVGYFLGEEDHGPGIPSGASGTRPSGEMRPVADTEMVPLLTTIPMGDPWEAIEVTDEFVRTTPAEAAGCNFAIKVVGNSMWPFFWDGDMVGVKLQQAAEDRQVVVARLESGETTLKMFRQDSLTGEAWLEPLNKSHPSIRGESFQVRGVVAWIRRSIDEGRLPSPV
jgi:SOS-response transcriptional repressor LexA